MDRGGRDSSKFIDTVIILINSSRIGRDLAIFIDTDIILMSRTGHHTHVIIIKILHFRAQRRLSEASLLRNYTPHGPGVDLPTLLALIRMPFKKVISRPEIREHVHNAVEAAPAEGENHDG